MQIMKLLLLLCFLLLHTAFSSNLLDQSSFPNDFLFGTSSSAYQYEGAYLADGKGLSNWDVFTHKPGRVVDESNGDIANDQYHRYLEDIHIMESLNVNSYRFSISWARVLPKGRFGEVNMGGINYYNNLIDALLLKGIQPFVTLWHRDIPQEIEERYGSWLSPESQKDFMHYAETCFKYFGDRVKYWATLNEPDMYVTNAYRFGVYPPARCSAYFGNCTKGDSQKEPYVVAHNMILSHAAAVHIYRTKYQKEQGGKIGISLHVDWYEPYRDCIADKLAVQRAQAFTVFWFTDPIILGKYPKEMEESLGNILPKFSSNEKKKLKQAGLDFIGINYYSTYYIKDCLHSKCEPGPGITRTEGSIQSGTEKNGIPLGKRTSINWLTDYPIGFNKILNYLKDKYSNTPMIITENGYGDIAELNSNEDLNLNDSNRIHYMEGHLDALKEAIRNGTDVRGYFVWSLLDNFEWISGFTNNFGLCYVDRTTMKRIPRLSASWYKNFIQTNTKKEKLQLLNYEGAYLADGKGLSNWDVFTHKPGRVVDESNGDIANDQYHRYLEDIDIMESLNVNSYRFSISWARVLPKGRFGEVNMGGINYYNNLIDALLLKGIQPFVTLWHRDIPQEIEERYGSWLSPESQKDFMHYAETCFKYFGDRVKYWATLNEPDIFVINAYRFGIYPPARCSAYFGNCTKGDSQKEPYVVAHNMILSHAAAVHIYRTKYQKEQGGKIGISLHVDWYEPYRDCIADKLAVQRAQAFTVFWFTDPIILGKYPKEMEETLGNILPKFSSNEKEKLKQAGLDFIGINYYSAYYIKDCLYSKCEPGPGITLTEGSIQSSTEKNGVPLGKRTSLDWLIDYPIGFNKILTYLKDKYNNTPMIITENGYGDIAEPNSTEDLQLNDSNRIHYMEGHLDALKEAIRNGTDVRGYFVWSLLDSFEWIYGYTNNFGLCYVDRTTMKRIPRLSASWYKNFIQTNTKKEKLQLLNVEKGFNTKKRSVS
ncbi:beta-glucosidase 46-like [Senna tora]|uniref:Beta-glucosidase 46-like n=1 Tax=Senna tora TaxID=362788 RepID=A0A834XAA5_9FABA|nr:beta-glucosidase 46-like [Senna tora]